MSRSFCVLPSPYPVENKGWRPSRRGRELASVVAFATTVLVVPVPAFAVTNWSACLHAADPSGRVAACTDIIESPGERKTMLPRRKKLNLPARDAASTPTTKSKIMLQIIEKWQVSAHNIRQQSYDVINNVRYCAADYQQNFQLPFDLALVSIGLPGEKGICANAVTYKIEKTLDDPRSFYVTHYCR